MKSRPMNKIHEFWDDRYKNNDYCCGKEPNIFLLNNYQHIPKGGRVLCLSEGEGRNAVFLASKGYRVTAVDLSEKAKEKAIKLARELNVQIEYDVADLSTYPIKALHWDGIVPISAHLAPNVRGLVHVRILKGLSESGVLGLEGYNLRQLDFATGGPKEKEMFYSKQMLDKDFSDLSILLSQDTVRNVNKGKFHKGTASVTQFIGKKMI